MSLIACKCPNCSADLDFDASRDIMFCSYCGTKVLKEQITHVTNNITIADGYQIHEATWYYDNAYKLIGKERYDDAKLQIDELRRYFPLDERIEILDDYLGHRIIYQFSSCTGMAELEDEKNFIDDYITHMYPPFRARQMDIFNKWYADEIKDVRWREAERAERAERAKEEAERAKEEAERYERNQMLKIVIPIFVIIISVIFFILSIEFNFVTPGASLLITVAMIVISVSIIRHR